MKTEREQKSEKYLVLVKRTKWILFFLLWRKKNNDRGNQWRRITPDFDRMFYSSDERAEQAVVNLCLWLLDRYRKDLRHNLIVKAKCISSVRSAMSNGALIVTNDFQSEEKRGSPVQRILSMISFILVRNDFFKTCKSAKTAKKEKRHELIDDDEARRTGGEDWFVSVLHNGIIW